jgi:hypothetical protein
MPLPVPDKSSTILMAVAIAFAAMISWTDIALGQNQTSNFTRGPPLFLPFNNTTTLADKNHVADNTTTSVATASAANMTLEEARAQYLSSWNRTKFDAAFDTFIEPFSSAGYGVYREHSNIFAPGETIVLYIEPVGFGHKQIVDKEGKSNATLYLMNITADYKIASANGTELQLIENTPQIQNITSHRPNTEMSLTLIFTQDVTPLPVGNYVITYEVHDEISGQSFQLKKQITIAEKMM